MGSDAPDDFTGERLRVACPWRPAICDELDDAEVADFFGDGVPARVLLQRLRGGDPASLREVDGIGRAGDFGTRLMSNTEVDSAVDAVNGMPMSVPSCVTHAGHGAMYTGVASAAVNFRCALDAVEVPGVVCFAEVERVAAGSAGVNAITFSGSCRKSCAGGWGGGCAVLINSRRSPKSIQHVKSLRPA